MTIGRDTHRVPDPFLVMATQNPIESEGTYPLPEAQVDRFMLKVLVSYPSATEEFVIVERMTGTIGTGARGARRPTSCSSSNAPQRRCTSIRRSWSTRCGSCGRRANRCLHGLDAIAPYVRYGASPRAAINLALSARARAFLHGRDYALPDDVRDLALDVMRHRLVLSYEALADGVTPDELLHQVLLAVSPPELPLMTAPAPSTPSRRDPSQAERLLRRLDWQVIRRLDGLLQGDHRALFYGSGSDFADLREYQPQDDVRYIDWNVTARLDTPYVRQYIDDRELTAWLLLDRSSSMRFGHVDRTKETAMVEMAATLGRLLTRDGNRIGAVLYDNTIERVVEPRGGRMQVLRLTRDLLRAPESAGAATDLGGLFRAGLQTMRRRSLVFVLSDFISEPGWERALGMLAQRHEVVARPHLGQPRGRTGRRRGRSCCSDAETGEQLVVDTSDPAFRRRFGEAVAARDEELRAAIRRAGVDQLRPLHRRRPRARPPPHGHHAQGARSSVTFEAPERAARAAARAGARRRVPVAGPAARRSTRTSLGTMAVRDARGRPLGWRRHVGPGGAAARHRRAARRPGPPAGDHRPPAAAGDGRARVRRVVEHEGQGPRADAHGRGQEGGAEVRGRRSRRTIRIGGRRLQRLRQRRAATDPVQAATCSTPSAASRRAAAPRSAGGSSPRSTRSPRQPITLDRKALEAGTRHPASKLRRLGRDRAPLRRRQHRAARPAWRWPRSPPRRACASSRWGIGSPDGAVVEIDGFSVATALDADLLRSVARDQRRHVLRRRRRGDAAADLRPHRPAAHDRRAQHRDHRGVRGRRAGAPPDRRRDVDALVRAGDLSLRFLWPLALLRTRSSRSRVVAAACVDPAPAAEVRGHVRQPRVGEAGDARAVTVAAARARRVCSWPRWSRWWSRWRDRRRWWRPRAATRRSCSPSTCRGRCARPT